MQTCHLWASTHTRVKLNICLSAIATLFCFLCVFFACQTVSKQMLSQITSSFDLWCYPFLFLPYCLASGFTAVQGRNTIHLTQMYSKGWRIKCDWKELIFDSMGRNNLVGSYLNSSTFYLIIFAICDTRQMKTISEDDLTVLPAIRQDVYMYIYVYMYTHCMYVCRFT